MTHSPPSLPTDYPTIGRSFDSPYEHSVEFDLTTFPSPDAFAALCDRHGLTDTDTVVTVSPDDIYSKCYHWYSDEVLLTTCCQPLSGEWVQPSGNLEYREPGYASYIMLRGARDPLVHLYEDIVETAANIKGGDVTECRITSDGAHIQREDRFSDRFDQ